ncbi:hypothetical protein A6770_11255 [Nostoc minutum NIES-26]|uniref:Uncharacterized protein n=1 Tax=Nostoc minutum NIES-26 TaxID=1844469 RepID=A0A367RVC1_9NOSO|nr:hypothetical protein A6770_11255 [Nostoc minutum NIES-26]
MSKRKANGRLSPQVSRAAQGAVSRRQQSVRAVRYYGEALAVFSQRGDAGAKAVSVNSKVLLAQRSATLGASPVRVLGSHCVGRVSRLVPLKRNPHGRGLPNKKIINRLGEQGRQGEKKLDTGIGCRN